MAASKTLNFLPEIFRTDANKKFLSATIDQLISEPDFRRVNGYIGRRVAPTFKSSDNYILESDKNRQNYQLEPCVISQDLYTNRIDFFSSYRDLLQKISYYGGDVSNQDRLFKNEYYTFDGCFDFDKFVNFNNYYWVPNGPDAVDVFAGEVDSEGEYEVVRNIATNGFNFSGRGKENNPVLTLARGGTYVFRVDQPGRNFWIQTEPGVSGTKSTQANVPTREVLGVINNGNDQGTVTFRVPLSTAQERFTSMTLAAVADFATEVSYVDVHNHGLREFLKSNPNGFDGFKDPVDIDGKYFIFINDDIKDALWTNDEIFDYYPYDIVLTETVPENLRRNVWRVQLVPSGNDYIINLVPSTTVLSNQKVFVRKGVENATREFFIDYDGFYKRVPIITANLDRLYYQDESDPTFVGEIRLVESDNVFIEVEIDIVGKRNYTSPNGVIFTNGLKVRFNSQVNPEKYRQKEYYVEGVGTSIKLIEVDSLTVPGYFDPNLENLDYITINRASPDLNAWTRSNRWFHIDVLSATASYNNTVDLPDNRYRATRPIIEFEANLQLYNYGREGLGTVDYLDFYINDAFSQVEGIGKPYDAVSHYSENDVVLLGNRVYRATIDLQQTPDNPSNWEDVGFLFDYNADRAFAVGQLAKYQNDIYRATYITDGDTPSDSPFWVPVAYFKDRSVEFNLEDNYQRGDLVEYNGKYYLCIRSSGVQGVSPTESDSAWARVDVYTAYNKSTSNEIEKDQYVTYNGNLYRATMDISQPPVGGDDFWEMILEIEDGKTVVFAGDLDIQVRNSVYVMHMETIDEMEVPHLTPILESGIKQNHTLVVRSGVNGGKSFWYDNSAWKEATLKTSVNQKPLFEVVDNDGVSFGDTDRYYNSNFIGTPVFSYKVGTGKTDPVLGFPFSYRNFNNVGDIEFNNDFDNSSMVYLEGTKEQTKKLNLGYLVSYKDRENVSLKNIWRKATESSHQYQVISHVFDGTTNYFEIDIDPSAKEKQIPYIKVYVNNRLLKKSQFKIETLGVKKCVRIVSTALSENSSVDILIYSDTPSSMGYYEVPPNLDFNAQNRDFEYLTLGQLKNHFFKISENTKEANETLGNFTGYRDVPHKQNGGVILQQASPVIYSNLFLQDEVMNFVDAADLASKEYIKFKNKFLEIASTLTITNDLEIPNIVDEILKNINFAKNESFPWYYSDMVPYGDNRREYLDVVINPLLKQFDLPLVFDDKKIGNRAILVYVNNHQLVKDRDYYFPQDRAAVIIDDSYDLQADDVIKIVDYSNTDGSYVPETPSKLGLFPKFVPYKYRDDSYRVPADVIQGHDGSITPAFGDFRDDLLIELERRIYNNIKVVYNENIINVYDFLPGKFRNIDYSLQEFEKVLSKSFLRWAGANRVDFSANTSFVANDAWTWNYWKYRDAIDGEGLPGSWRAIYKYFYDTVRPNTHPWEMLGFSEEPDWWQDRYGPAPYTGGNLLLWKDLSEGYIHAGPRAGNDKKFARPGLLNIIPVDEYGALRSPNLFAVAEFSSRDAGRSFAIGNQGPAEYAWRSSSDYPFALQRAMALTRPAFYFGSLMNVERYNRNTKIDQLVISDTLRRISPESVVIHSDKNADGSVIRTAGYLNWIRDYISTLGKEPVSYLKQRLKNLSVKLGYQLAGYTDKNYIKVLAEQSSPTSVNDSVVLPDENYYIHLSKSSPVKKIVYSGVIIEKTSNGYTVSGYDLSNPYFTIIPSLANNNAYVIEVGEQRGVIYKDYQSKKITVPYGYEFTTRQQVVDFLVSYGRYLAGQGFQFIENEPQLATRKDWVLSAKEFLHWSQQGWSNGNLIILSPVGSTLRVVSQTGVINHITNTVNGSKLLDQQFSTIKSNQFSIVRGNNDFKVTALSGSTICLAELELVQYEHALIFDNVTVFNDIIYKPELGNRQYRLKLIGSKTGSWTGEMNPPGFIYNSEYVDEWQAGKDYKKGSVVKFKEQYYTALGDIIAATEFVQSQWTQIERSSIKTGLLPNFAYNAQKFENIYDVDNAPSDLDLLEYSAGLIGFRERAYLSDFGLDPLSQVKFYQGFIKDKGTKNSIDSLTSAKLNNISSEIDFYEEWAVRVGEYGAVDSDAQIEIVLDESKITSDPITVEFLDINETADPSAIGFKVSDIYRRTGNYKKDIFTLRDENSDLSNDILTAGYVNINDVDASVFDIRDTVKFDQYLSMAGRGVKIWVAKDFENNWNVYRVNETDNNVTNVRYDLDENIMFFFEEPHGLVEGEVFVVKGIDEIIDGFYRVNLVVDAFKVTSEIYKNSEDIKKTRNFSGPGVFLKTKSMRVDKPTDIEGLSPIYGWLNNDRVWVENSDTLGKWAVYEKSQPWQYKTTLSSQASEFLGQDLYGYAVKMNSQGDLVTVSSPTTKEGNVKTFVKLITGEFRQSSTLKPTQIDGVAEFGKSLDLADYTTVVGAPGSWNNQGIAYVYNFRQDENLRSPQILFDPNGQSGHQFGHSVCISENTNWIYVGAPGANQVLAYYKDIGVVPRIGYADVVPDTTVYDIPFENDQILTARDTEMLQVSIGTKVLIPTVEYTITNNQISFSKLDLYLVVEKSTGQTVAEFRYGDWNEIVTIDGVDRLALDIEFENALVDNDINVADRDLYFYRRYYDGFGITFSVMPGYRYAYTISNDVNDSRFGHIVKTNRDGSRLIVGAPDYDLTKYAVVDGEKVVDEFRQDKDGNLILDSQGNPIPVYRRESGAVYFYHRRVESIAIKSSQLLYEPGSTATDIVAVRVGEKTMNPRNEYRVNLIYRVFEETDSNTTLGTFQIVEGDDVDEKFEEFLIASEIEESDFENYSYEYISKNLELASFNESGQNLQVDTKTFDLAQFISSPDPIDYNHFGQSIDIDLLSHYLYVGAPGYRDENYSKGKVYKFVDSGKIYGKVSLSGDVDLSLVDSIFVNRVPVKLTAQDSSIETLMSDINLANIPGVTASVVDNSLIVSDLSPKHNGIEIYQTSGNDFPDIGVNTFELDQEIIEPDENVGSFGTTIRVDRTGGILLISSSDADLQQDVLFDLSLSPLETSFDKNTTRFLNTVRGSGVVYMYQSMTDPDTGIDNAGSMMFVEKLSLRDAYFGDQFGHATDINKEFMLISSPGFDPIPDRSEYDIKVNNLKELSFINTDLQPDGTKILVLTDSNEQGRWSLWEVLNGSLTKQSSASLLNIGSLHLYTNPLNKKPWSAIRTQETQVDLAAINRLMVYDRKTNTIIANLDFIDPAKGKILGAAEQDIDFKTEHDPAVYTNAIDGLNIDPSLKWGEQQVGSIWWNLSKVRFLDYEQSSLLYRTTNWGSIFPGSTIEICEWVSSSVPPAQYVARGGTGTPLYNNQCYVVDTVIDSQSGIVNPRYYFWVSGKQETTVKRKKNSAAAIKNIIEQPSIQGIPYAGIVKSNAIALFGVGPYLSGQDVVLKIDYANIPNENTIHSEFELVQENRGENQIPTKILDKLVDSLAGVDRVGNVVPDPRLSDSERVGISYRPRQNMFVDRAQALKNIVEFINRIFKNLPMVRQFNIDRFLSQDPLPTQSGYDRKVNSVEELDYISRADIGVGYRVLIEKDATNDDLWTVWTYNGQRFNLSRIQVYKTDLYWNFIDWYDENFDPTGKVNFSVDYVKDIGTLDVVPGNTIKVRFDQDGRFAFYRISDSLQPVLVGLENGTIELSSDLYDLSLGGMGFDSANFDNVRYDKTPGIEIREILDTIRTSIFVGEFKEFFNRLFFVAVNYLLSEQKHNDWIFKTSFINIVHRLRKLDQYPSFVRDNQDYYIDYINEVKPYRTQIREYLLNYNGDEHFRGNITDFDLSPYYDRNSKQYRSPNGENIGDEELWNRQEYRDWNANHTFVIDRIVVENPGTGYTVIPVITVEGGGGTGAILKANTDYNGIVSVDVVNPGTGYTSTPTVTINGNGTGAKAYAVLRNTNGRSANGYNLVRSVDTRIKFDRISYEATIPEWLPNAGTENPKIYSDLVHYDKQVYRYKNKNIFAVPVVMSAIETNTVELIDTFVVTQTTLDNETPVFINDVRATLGVGYTIDEENNTLTLLDPRFDDEIRVRYVGDQGNDEEETFVVSNRLVYQLNKNPKDFSKDQSGNYQVFVADILKTSGTDYTIEDREITFVSSAIETGQQIKVYVESNVVSVVDPSEVQGSLYDESLQKWFVEINKEKIYLDNIDSVEEGQQVRGSGVNGLRNSIIVTQVNRDENEILLSAEDKTQFEFKQVLQESSSLSFTNGTLSDVKTKIYFDKDTEPADSRRYVIDNETNSLTLVDPSLLPTELRNLPMPGWIKAEFVYNEPAVLVLGKNVIEVLHFISPITTDDVFDYRVFAKLNGDEIDNAIDRASAYYLAVEGGTGEDPGQVIKGLRYPGVLVQGLPYDQDEESDVVADLVDTHISSRYKDSALGTRPEDITVDGGKYVDKFSSHAPEEMIPGIIFDSLNMQVFTKPIRPWTEGPFTISDSQQTDFELTENVADETNSTIVLDGKILIKDRDYSIVSQGKIIRLKSQPRVGTELVVYGFEVTGDHYGHRVFHDISESRNYYRISSEFSTRLINDLDLFDDEIVVTDASALSSPTVRNPGQIFINGEVITYLRNYAREPRVDWETLDTSSTISADKIVVYQGNHYLTQTNIRSSVDFDEHVASGAVKEININTLTRIRRGVGGTGAPAKHLVGSRVVDASDSQLMPGDADADDWMNSAEEFGFKEVGDFDLFPFDANEQGEVPDETTADEMLARPETERTGARFDSTLQRGDIAVIPSEQARFLSKSPSFSP